MSSFARSSLLHVFVAALAVALLGACGDEDPALCDGAECANAEECPNKEPKVGDKCDFGGNCHYCEAMDEDASAARKYTCDGTAWTTQGAMDCDPA